MSAIKEPQQRIIELETELAQLQIFRQFADASGQGLGIGTLDGRVVYMNPTLCRLVGAGKLTDALNQPFALYYPEEMQPRLQNEVMPVVMQQGQWTGELALTNGDIITPTLENFFIIRDNQGQPLYLADVVTDITEQKLTEAKIEAEVEARTDEVAVFRALVENATDGVMLGSLEGKFSYANHAAYELYGYNYEEKEIVGLSVADVNPAEMMPIVAQEIMPTIMQTGGWQGETKQCRKDGTIFDIYLTTFLIKDETGQPASLAAIVRDLTKLKQKEVEARQLAAIVESAALAILSTKPTGEIVSWNPAAVRMFGYTPEEIIGQSLLILTPPHLAAQTQTILKHLLQGERVETVETKRLTKDGREMDVLVSPAPVFDAAGKVVGFSATMADITAQKEAQAERERLNLAIAQTSDGVALTDLEGKVQFVNPAWAHMHGYEPAELIGQHLSMFHTPAQLAQEAQPALAHTMQTGAYEGEVGHQKKDGATFPTWMTVTLIKDESGQPIGLSGTARDITGQKEAVAEREKLQEEIIEAQRHAIAELSTPVIPIMDNIIVMPLIGSIDSLRARDITRTLLSGISQNRAKVVILDVTGVAIMDTGVVNHLNKTIQAARLKGAHTIVTGISDAVAEAIVDLGIDWSGIQTLNDLQTGLVIALGSLGMKLSRA